MDSKKLKAILQQHKLWVDSEGEKGRRADFASADLESADLRDADLTGVNLYKADLCEANLYRADLGDACFKDANLYKADLSGADLSGASLYCANLRGANLTGVNIKSANLSFANFYNAKGVIQWQSPQGVKRNCYSVKHDLCVMHKLGCFWGNTVEAVEAIQKKYGENSLYEKFLLMQVEALEE